VLNLLPIPVLDGGHLVYFAIEGVRGRPLSEATMEQAQRIGLALLLTLMAVALYVDLDRFLG
jgi:regulator of sigma E protease